MISVLKKHMEQYFIKLKNRGLIHLEGSDRHDFLQNLVTNDISLLTTDQSVYACLLTPQGKFLHDFFILEGDGFTLLDCEGGARAQDLYSRLNMYRLRKDVQISIEEQNDVYAVFNADTGLPDPRHQAMGRRSFEKPDLPEAPFETWDALRISLTIPDGSRDLIPEKSTMAEGRMDTLNAVDYNKGCYVGQEVTARIHHKGLAKKQLRTFNTEDIPENAERRSECNGLCIALTRI